MDRELGQGAVGRVLGRGKRKANKGETFFFPVGTASGPPRGRFRALRGRLEKLLFLVNPAVHWKIPFPFALALTIIALEN